MSNFATKCATQKQVQDLFALAHKTGTFKAMVSFAHDQGIELRDNRVTFDIEVYNALISHLNTL